MTSDVVWAVVVARAGTGAKSRLASVLSPAERHDLVLAMLADVLGVCHSTPELQGVVVVTDAPLDVDAATVRLDDPRPADMNAAVTAGIDAACARGARTAIVLPADIPCLSSADLRHMLAAAADAPRAAVIGGSRNGEGTNALLLRPPDAIRPAFGPPSVERHRQLAESAGCHTVVLSHLSLALDIDTPEDLATLRATPALPPHTARFVTLIRL